MKICLIGNSHVACVKKAYDLVGPEELGFTIDFFASTGDSICNTKMVDEALVPTQDLVKNSWAITSGGKESIRFDDYEAIVIHGLTLPLSTLSSYAVSLEDNRLYSADFQARALLAADHKLFHLSNLGIFGFCNKVIVTSRPNVARDSGKNIDPQEHSEMEALINGLLRAADVNYIAQPFETLVNINDTLAKYATDGLGLGNSVATSGYKAVNSENNTHMNAEYGKYYLEKLKLYINNGYK